MSKNYRSKTAINALLRALIESDFHFQTQKFLLTGRGLLPQGIYITPQARPPPTTPAFSFARRHCVRAYMRLCLCVILLVRARDHNKAIETARIKS